MRGIMTDGRDVTWEDHDVRFRVHLFAGADYATTTMDIVEASVTDAMDAAATLAGTDKLWSLAVVRDDGGGGRPGRGLIWLSGMDYHDAPSSPREWRMRAEMQNRFLSAHARRVSGPPLLPDGRRVIRMFFDHGHEWPLWESFTDHYTMTPHDYGLSDSLTAALRAWSAAWTDRPWDSPLPDGWHEEGWRLYRILVGEVADFAEVRPEFAGDDAD